MVQLGPLSFSSGGTAKLLAQTCLLWLRQAAQGGFAEPEPPLSAGDAGGGRQDWGLGLVGGAVPQTERDGSGVELTCGFALGSWVCFGHCHWGFLSGGTTRRQHFASLSVGAWDGSKGDSRAVSSLGQQVEHPPSPPKLWRPLQTSKC